MNDDTIYQHKLSDNERYQSISVSIEANKGLPLTVVIDAIKKHIMEPIPAAQNDLQYHELKNVPWRGERFYGVRGHYKATNTQVLEYSITLVGIPGTQPQFEEQNEIWPVTPQKNTQTQHAENRVQRRPNVDRPGEAQGKKLTVIPPLWCLAKAKTAVTDCLPDRCPAANQDAGQTNEAVGGSKNLGRKEKGSLESDTTSSRYQESDEEMGRQETYGSWGTALTD